MTELRTERLLLRHWRRADAEPWAELNADPRVMEHFPSPLSRNEADWMRRWHGRHLDEHGWGLWAVEVVGGAPFIGFVGMMEVDFDASFTPAVEIGWRLAAASWGKGLASEAATAVLAHAFDQLEMTEIVSFTATTNSASEAVMRRIGMTAHPSGPFDHPKIEPGHRLERHVLYRLTASEWQRQHPQGQQ